MRTRTLTVLAVAALVLVMAGCSYEFGTGGSDTTTTTTTTTSDTTTTSATGATETYTSSLYGFEVDFPAGWTVEENVLGDGTLELLVDSNMGDDAFILMDVTPDFQEPGEFSMYDLYYTPEEYADSAADTYDDYNALDVNQLSIDGYDAYKLEYEHMLAGYPTTSYEYSFLTSTDLILFYGHADPAVFDDYRDEFESSIESFRSI